VRSSLITPHKLKNTFTMVVLSQRSVDVRIAAATAAAIQTSLLVVWQRRNRAKQRRSGCNRLCKRERRTVHQIHETLGPYFFRRAYRMSYTSFNKLAHTLQPYMKVRDYTRVTNKNGPIHNNVRVACAIRYFAGGSPYDIATTYGIGVCEIYKSIWDVVDAVHSHPDFEIKYPTLHDEQIKIAECFLKNRGSDSTAVQGRLMVF
jgi:hypothetical protein